MSDLIALDGCRLHCVAQILKRQGLTAARHYDLSKMGVSKKKYEDFDPKQAAAILQCIVEESKVPAPNYAVVAKQAPLLDTPEEELPELSSPVCYAKEFEDW